MIIPDAVRASYVDNLIGGLAMNLAGTAWSCGCCSTASSWWWAC